MVGSILQADVENRGIVLDPRTKMLLLIDMAVFVIGGAGGNLLQPLAPVFCTVPLILLLSAKQYKKGIIYTIVYSLAYISYSLWGNSFTGPLNSLLLGTTNILTRFLPSIMMGVYLVSTTTVSEFTSAMSKLHISETIIIPLSVMFRFFPTVIDEFSSINAAMKMRDIRFGGKNVGKILEYRIVPLMVCTAKIGEELSAAALTRGLGGKVKRTNVCQIGFRIQDIIIIILCLVPYIMMILKALKIL